MGGDRPELRLFGGEARQALALTLVVWLVFVYGSYVVSELIGGHAGFLQDLPLDLPAVVIVALIAQTLYPVARATSGWRPWARWLLLFAITVPVAFAQSIVNLLENRLLGVIPALDAAHLPLIRQRFGRNFLSHVYLSFANAALLVFLVEARTGAAQRLRLATSELEAFRAQGAALRLQLNPHFLFNTLNSISSLVVTRRNDDAEEMLARLAEFLRQSLDADPAGMVRLDEEFATVETYLAIEAVRFGERMRMQLCLPPALAEQPVPHLLLQPLAENAIKHGLAQTSGPVTIDITAAEDGGVLELVVRNSGVPAARAAMPGLGVGLANIRERLAHHYGDAATLLLEHENGGFTAAVRLPRRPTAHAGTARAWTT